MNTKRGTGGFTLLELMMVLVIVAFLAMAALPFAKGWMDSTQQSDARNRLAQAVGQAQSLATRNPDGAAEGEAVSRLSISRRAVVVTNAADDQVVWQTVLPANVSVLNGKTGELLTCMEWDSRGAVVVTHGCQHTRQARLSMEGQDALTVDLL